MESLDPGVDVVASRSNLETLVVCWKLRRLTLDALSRCGQTGDLKSKQEGLVNLPLNAGCRGSLDTTTETTDEVIRTLQSAQAYGARRDLPNWVMMRKSHTQ